MLLPKPYSVWQCNVRIALQLRNTEFRSVNQHLCKPELRWVDLHRVLTVIYITDNQNEKGWKEKLARWEGDHERKHNFDVNG